MIYEYKQVKKHLIKESTSQTAVIKSNISVMLGIANRTGEKYD